MLGFNEAMLIMNFVNTSLFEGESVLTLEDAASMYPLPGARHEQSYTVLGIQMGDQTILVWVQFTEHGLRVRNARKQNW